MAGKYQVFAGTGYRSHTAYFLRIQAIHFIEAKGDKAIMNSVMNFSTNFAEASSLNITRVERAPSSRVKPIGNYRLDRRQF